MCSHKSECADVSYHTEGQTQHQQESWEILELCQFRIPLRESLKTESHSDKRSDMLQRHWEFPCDWHSQNRTWELYQKEAHQKSKKRKKASKT